MVIGAHLVLKGGRDFTPVILDAITTLIGS